MGLRRQEVLACRASSLPDSDLPSNQGGRALVPSCHSQLVGHPEQSLSLWASAGDEGAEALVNRVIEAADFQLIEEEGWAPGMALLGPAVPLGPLVHITHTSQADVMPNTVHRSSGTHTCSHTAANQRCTQQDTLTHAHTLTHAQTAAQHQPLHHCHTLTLIEHPLCAPEAALLSTFLMTQQTPTRKACMWSLPFYRRGD